MPVADQNRQAVLDSLQETLGDSDNARIVVLPVEVVLPRPEADADSAERKDNAARKSVGATREELYHQIEKGARRDTNFLILVVLSTVVAGIGLLENNIAVSVGAMVIAPLLGPNLALASGAAAALSLTSGVASALAGVMVAVALLPPTATLGMMLASAQQELAAGAALLLAVNIVSVNLSATLVFLFKGVRPRTWIEKRKAQQSAVWIALFWTAALAMLLMAVYLRNLAFEQK
jgi:uncharacterized membrane protein